MQTQLQREKLLNAMAFFSKATKRCHKTKLFKLLYLFDFGVFRETGRSPTGLDYFAWPKGPVPRALFLELDAPRPDMRSAMVIRSSIGDISNSSNSLHIAPKQKPDLGVFTKRELVTLERLAEVYLEADADDMVEVTHLRGEPWHRVYEVEGRKQELIPYELALDDQPGSISKERAEIIRDEEREKAELFG